MLVLERKAAASTRAVAQRCRKNALESWAPVPTGTERRDCDLEERAAKKSGCAEAVSVYKGPVSAANMEIPA